MTQKSPLLFIGLVALFFSSGFGQSKSIKVRFEAEGRLTDLGKATIVFHTKGGSYLSTVKKNRIIVPREATETETLDVQVLWDNQSAIFTSVSQEYLKGVWTVGVDKGPSVDESLVSDANKGKEVLVVYYLKLDPDDLIKVITIEVLR